METAKKILIINQFANTPDLPGHTRQYEIAKGLNDKGWNVDVFASDFNLSERRFKKLDKFEFYKYELYKKVNWFWIRVSPYNKNDIFRYFNIISFCINLFLILLIKVLKKLISRHKLVIISSSPQLPATLIALIIAKLFSVPFVSEIRDLWPQVLIDLGGKRKNSLFIKFLLFIEKTIYLYSDHVIVLAEGSIGHVKEKGAKNISFLPNGSDLNFFKYYDLMPENKTFSNLRTFNLIYYGAHGKANALDTVIDAAKMLKDKPIKFTLMGDGTEKKSLIKKSSNMGNINFLDPKSKKEMALIISKFDAVIITLQDIPLFKYGVSPNKLYDAYAIGRPVISNIGGSIAREIAEKNIGINAKPNDAKSLAKSITELMNLSRSERKEMSKRARLLAETKYSRKIIVSNYNKILNKLI